MQEKREETKSEAAGDDMAIFLGSFFAVVVLLFMGALYMTRLSLREQKEPEFHNKMERIRASLGPKFTFFENAFWWVVAFAVVYMLVMSGSNFE